MGRGDVPAREIGVQLSEREPTVTGQIEERERKRWHRKMRRTGRFEFRTMLPGGVDADRVEAHLPDGVPTITCPRRGPAEPRHIEVSV
ncbi:HSP20 family protein [Nonomuraea solani]|uniref:HSP20 family protein n=1 Tax=Nonomuraea solani TaxID=1144553 RepID=A0A1H6EH74_9ACTN|nr:Hsp20 family protein [Nonomuraea solani]SEG96296.1 HSP20 family protein [Nonomuraea solani]